MLLRVDLSRPLSAKEDSVHPFYFRRPGKMRELYSSEKRMQLLPGGSAAAAAAAARRAIQRLIEIVNGSKNRIRVVLANNSERPSGGHCIPSTLPTTCHAADPEHATTTRGESLRE